MTTKVSDERNLEEFTDTREMLVDHQLDPVSNELARLGARPYFQLTFCEGGVQVGLAFGRPGQVATWVPPHAASPPPAPAQRDIQGGVAA